MVHEKRFEKFDDMPKIASKYKRSDMGPEISKFKPRDLSGLIKPIQGAVSYAGNEVYIYPKVHGAIEIAKYSQRKPIIKEDFQPRIFQSNSVLSNYSNKNIKTSTFD